MSLSQPAAPDPTQVSNEQSYYNQQAAGQQAAINDVGQSTPYGTLTYNQTGTGPGGVPMYTATQKLSPAEQGLFNATTGTQQTVANDAGQLATSLGSSLTSAPNLSTDALTKQLLGWQTDYMQPYFGQESSNLQSQLAAQGITQGSTAYNNATRSLNQNQEGSMENAMAGDEAQAYGQALSTYQAPIQTLGTLLGEGQPGTVNSSLVSTPQEQVQAPDYAGTAEQQYQQQNQQYANTMGGLFGVGSALAGGWAKAGFPGVSTAVGALGALSDRRAKRDISEIGRLFDGQPIYRFRYHADPEMRIGLMAQDVAEVEPDAVMTGDDGFMRVDYERATDNAAGAANG